MCGKVDAAARLDVYRVGVSAIEVSHALSGCDFQRVLPIGIAGVVPSKALRWQPAKTLYRRSLQETSDTLAPWRHPLARFLVSELENRPRQGDHGKAEQTIELSGVDAEPPLLDLLTGIVWDHSPPNPDDYNSCLAVVAQHHELGFLEGENWTPLSNYEDRDVYLSGAVTADGRVVAVVGTSGVDNAILPLSDGPVADATWTFVATGVYHDEDVAFADPRLGPYCGP